VQGPLLATGGHRSAVVAILPERPTDGYTTFADVYRYIRNDTQIESGRTLEALYRHWYEVGAGLLETKG
jgi:hypothetical protein